MKTKLIVSKQKTKPDFLFLLCKSDLIRSYLRMRRHIYKLQLDFNCKCPQFWEPCFLIGIHSKLFIKPLAQWTSQSTYQGCFQWLSLWLHVRLSKTILSRIYEYISVVDRHISFKISLVFVCRQTIFCLRVFGLKKLKLIFNSSYYSWESFVLSLSSNLLFTWNRSFVLMF